MAKFCSKCGAKLDEHEKFCSKCGNQIKDNINTSKQPKVERPTTYHQSDKIMPSERTRKKQNKSKISKSKKAKIIIISVAIALAIVLVSLVTVYFTSPAYSVYKNLKGSNCSTAIREYKGSVEDNFIQEVLMKMALNGYSEKILDEFKNGKIEFEDALLVLETMKELNVKNVDEAIAEINRLNAAKTAFAAADKYYAGGDYENAIKEYSKITDADSQFADAQAKLTELYPKYAESIVNKANQLSAAGAHAEAVSLINTAIGILPPDSADIAKLNQAKSTCLDLYKKEILDNSTSLISQGKYVDAIHLINNAITVDDNEDFQNAKTTAETEYINNVTATVNAFIAQEDYISAERNVKAALNVLPNNSELIALQKTVTDVTPTYLLDVCKPYSSLYYTEYINGERFNMGGTEYTNGFTITGDWGDGGNAIFNLNGNFRTVSFNLGHVDGTDMTEKNIKIYCDGVLKAEHNINAYNLPQKVTIDIAGVNQLKIIYEDGSYYPAIGFGNVIVK